MNFIVESIDLNSLVNGAAVIGFVNLVSVFFPYYTGSSKVKAGLALVAALVLTYIPIPPQIGDVVNLLFGSSGLQLMVAADDGATGTWNYRITYRAI